MTTVSVLDFDVVYLSYDEPNAEENYEDLLTKIPWAKHIHGVKGSDSAHKACANVAETERFITVDGDNIVNEEFLHQTIEYDEDADLSNTVFSWSARNTINGLIYGNGGIKCWPRDLVLNMQTHENADPSDTQSQVDFCWKLDYQQQNTVMSTVYNNASSHQAWRAGFREGVKMSLDSGVKQTKEELLKSHWKNLHRLYIWTMIGADAERGDWAILGARAGLYKTMCSDWDYVNVRDFEYLNNLWNEEFVDFQGHEVYDESCRYTNLLVKELGIPIDDPLTSNQSKFFKTVYLNPSRTGDRAYIL